MIIAGLCLWVPVWVLLPGSVQNPCLMTQQSHVAALQVTGLNGSNADWWLCSMSQTAPCLDMQSTPAGVWVHLLLIQVDPHGQLPPDC